MNVADRLPKIMATEALEVAPPARSTTAAAASARTARYRRRQRKGLKVFPLTLNEHDVVLALIFAGYITDETARDPRVVRAALGCFVGRWAKAEIKRHA